MSTEKTYTTTEPFKAEILITQESYDLIRLKDNGYTDKIIHVDGGIMLKLTVTAPSLEALQRRITGHVGMIGE